MFGNIGKKIQAISTTIFVLQSLLGVLLGMAVGAAVGTATGSVGPALMAALVIIAIFVFVAWLSQLVLYAYGKITECSEEQVRLLRQIVALQGGEAAEAGPKKRVCACGEELDADAVFCPVCGKRCQ